VSNATVLYTCQSLVLEVTVMWTSPYPPVEVGGTTLHEMVLEAAARCGDRPALVDGPSGRR
jgi:hypothetical protein